MIFQQAALPGVYTIDIEPHTDERGFFARTWDRKEFLRLGLTAQMVHCNLSHNRIKGTLRGMQYQRSPFEEARLVRCVGGEIYDVIIDLRPASPTYKQHISVILNDQNHRAIYIPHGCAHGFITLINDTLVLYQMSQVYHPPSIVGIRYNDPMFNIQWPTEVRMISEKDKSYPDFL